MAAVVQRPLIPFTLPNYRPSRSSSVKGQILHRRQTSSPPVMKPGYRESAATPGTACNDAQEWKPVLAAAKRHHSSKDFHQCFIVCQEALSITKSHENVEPAYLIYLHFYAANALEMQAQILHRSSSHRSSLILQAREHYQHAASLLATEETVNARPSRRSSSSAPGLVSPVGSISTQSTISSRAPSPDASILGNARRSSKHSKRVTFQEPINDPIIRPDSPTLGFDEWLGRSASEPAPEPVVIKAQPMPSPTFPSYLGSSPPAPVAAREPSDPFALVRSVHRYCTILSDLQRQIASHLASIDADLSAAQDSKAAVLDSEELRDLELKTRIQRLRANGWRRPRFDAQKYRQLRETATADLMG